MERFYPHLVAAWAAATLGLFVWQGYRALESYRIEQRLSPYTYAAKAINGHRLREACDASLAQQRLASARVVDRFREQIQALWRERGTGGEPKFALVNLGVIQLKSSPRAKIRDGFDSSSWSWDEAYALIQRIQREPGHPETKQRWRDVDSMVKFLVEKDVGRLVYGRKFLPPDVTQHQFRPNPGVIRTGPKEFTVRMNIGDFTGKEEVLQKMLEEVWQGNGFRVKVAWGQEDGLYSLRGHSRSSRSFVNHRTRTMEIANLAWTKTVAHELGHVLGFDDHYYNVWNSRNCYYSLESRLADIMSSSDQGGLTPRHWEILDQAYPWRAQGPKDPFFYTYGK